ncbi:MAG: hypothetical protein JSS07_08190 [Proteobacteria bacterium]|nr:hypothetical protein [Pseudomonadota bacterium]
MTSNGPQRRGLIVSLDIDDTMITSLIRNSIVWISPQQNGISTSKEFWIDMLNEAANIAQSYGIEMHVAVITRKLKFDDACWAVAEALEDFLKKSNPLMYITKKKQRWCFIQFNDSYEYQILLNKNKKITSPWNALSPFIITSPKPKSIRLISLATRLGISPQHCIHLDDTPEELSDMQNNKIEVVSFQEFHVHRDPVNARIKLADPNFVTEVLAQKKSTFLALVRSQCEKIQKTNPIEIPRNLVPRTVPKMLNAHSVNELYKIENYKKLILENKIPDNLSAQDILTLFKSPDVGNVDFLYHCLQQPEISDTIINICNIALHANDTAQEMQSLLTVKYQDKTPLYYACEANNIDLINWLRQSFDACVNEAGPSEAPSALLRAGQVGAFEAINALLSSKPKFPRLSGKPIERRVLDNQGKTVLHWIAQNQNEKTIETIYQLLASASSSFHAITNIVDNDGNSAFFYLLQNPLAKEILQSLVQKGKGTYITWYLDTYFDFNTKRKNGFTDLEWAMKTNSEIAHYISQNLSTATLAQKAQLNMDIVTKFEAIQITETKVIDFQILSLPGYVNHKISMTENKSPSPNNIESKPMSYHKLKD